MSRYSNTFDSASDRFSRELDAHTARRFLAAATALLAACGVLFFYALPTNAKGASWELSGTNMGEDAVRSKSAPFSDGSVQVSWQTPTSVLTQRMNSDGSVIPGSTPVELFNYSSDVELTPISDDVIAATAIVGVQDGYEFRTRFIARSGLISETSTLATGVSSGGYTIFATGDGTLSTAWIESAGGTHNLKTTRIAASGEVGTIRSAYEAHDEDQRTLSGAISGSAAGDGTTWLLWTEVAGGGLRRTLARRIGSTGFLTSPSEVAPFSGWQSDSAIAAGPNGDARVVWSVGGYWTGFLYTAGLSSAGELIVNPSQCYAGSEGYSPSNQQCLGVTSGSFWSPNQPWEVAVASTTDKGHPNVGLKRNPYTVVARSRSGPLVTAHIYDRVVDNESGLQRGVVGSSSTVPSEGIPSNGSAGQHTGPSVVPVGDGRAVAMWGGLTRVEAVTLDERGPKGKVSQFLPSGGLGKPSLSVSKNPSNPNTYFPIWASWTNAVPGKVTAAKFDPLASDDAPIDKLLSLGDSVSSGEGTGYDISWDDDADRWKLNSSDENWLDIDHPHGFREPGEGCHRSENAFPQLLEVVSRVHLACSGATAWNVLNTQSAGGSEVQAQLPELDGSTPYEEFQPDVVTLTVGANDVNFAGLVEACYMTKCGDAWWEDNVQQSFEGQTSDLRDLLARLESAQGAKRPLILVGQYYDPFPVKYQNCVDTTPRQVSSPAVEFGASLINRGNLTSEEMSWLRSKLKQLNQHISDVVKERDGDGARKYPDAQLVDLGQAVTANHRWCTSDPWVYGASVAAPESVGGIERERASFHPTVVGQDSVKAQFDKAMISTPSNPGSRAVAAGPSWLDFVIDTLSLRAFVNSVSSNGRLAITSLLDMYHATSRSSQRNSRLAADAIDPPEVNTFPNDIAITSAFEVTAAFEHDEPITLDLGDVADDDHAYQRIDGAWTQLAEARLDTSLRVTLQSDGVVVVGHAVPPVTASIAPVEGGTAPDEISFDGSASSVESGTIEEFNWSFGDGESAVGASPTHTFAAAGTYEVRLEVRSDAGATNTAVRSIAVSAPAPSLQIAGPSEIAQGEVGAFTVAAETGDQSATVVEWKWMDQATSFTGANVFRTFSSPGTYSLEARIANESGEIAVDDFEVRVSPSTDPPALLPTPSRAVSTSNSKLSRKTLRRARKFNVSCGLTFSGKCTAVATLTRAQAARLGISVPRRASRVKVASGSASLRANVRSSIPLRPKPAVLRRLLGVSRKVKIAVSLVGEDVGGRVSTTATITLSGRLR